MKSKIEPIILVFIFFFSITTQGQRQLRTLMEGFPSVMDQPHAQEHPDAKALGPALFNHLPPLKERYSPVKKQFVGTSDGKLYLRAQKSDAHIWSLPPEKGFYWHIDNALWSPNGRYLVAKQVDDRDVPEIVLTTVDPETKTSKKYSRAGQNIAKHIFYIIEQKTGDHIKIDLPPELPYIHVLEWSNSGDKIYLLAADRLMKEVHLRMIDATTGKATTMLTEKADTYILGLELLQGYSDALQNMDLAVFLDKKQQFTWLSERSGHKQIYLYDYDGTLIRPLTDHTENGIVAYIDHIDKETGWLYFLAHSNADRPYDLQLFKTNLNAPQILKIVDTPGLMELKVPTDTDTLWVLRSKLPRTLQVDRYSPQGEYYDTAWEGNFSAVGENYFNYEYVNAKAADGTTDLEALILKPKALDPIQKYPIVEYIYGGNFMNVVPRNLLEPQLWEMNSLAQEGFIVVFIDGRGTPGRGKKFKDFSYGKFGQVELEDHTTVLKQIAKDRPYMDLGNTGIMGHSWGGHFALRALLEAPEIYKAGHINAPAFEPSEFRVVIEAFMGCLPQDCPELYQKSSIMAKLKHLKAPIMIVHGTNDDDVPIEDSYKLVKMLDALNYRNHEFEIYPGYDHIVMRNREWLPNMIRFFKAHLK